MYENQYSTVLVKDLLITNPRLRCCDSVIKLMNTSIPMNVTQLSLTEDERQ